MEEDSTLVIGPSFAPEVSSDEEPVAGLDEEDEDSVAGLDEEDEVDEDFVAGFEEEDEEDSIS